MIRGLWRGKSKSDKCTIARLRLQINLLTPLRWMFSSYRNCNLIHKIFGNNTILVQVSFAKSKKKINIYYKNLVLEIVSQVANGLSQTVRRYQKNLKIYAKRVTNYSETDIKYCDAVRFCLTAWLRQSILPKVVRNSFPMQIN